MPQYIHTVVKTSGVENSRVIKIYLTIDIQNMMKHNILQQLRLEHITWRFLKYIWHVELYCVIWKVSPCNYSLNTFLHTESVSCQTYSSLIPIKYTLLKVFSSKMIFFIESIACCNIVNSYDDSLAKNTGALFLLWLTHH